MLFKIVKESKLNISLVHMKNIFVLYKLDKIYEFMKEVKSIIELY